MPSVILFKGWDKCLFTIDMQKYLKQNINYNI